MCFNFSADQFQPTGFRLPKPKKRFSMLPTCRTTARMKGIDSPRWRLFSDVSFQRQTDGSELAGWRIAGVSADNFVRILCGPVTCDPGHPAFLGATSRSNNTAEVTSFAEALRWIDSFIPCDERVRMLYDSKHAARVALDLIGQRGAMQVGGAGICQRSCL